LVEQRTENPCVGGSIPPQATSNFERFPLLKQFDGRLVIRKATANLSELT
jgi:hypothetical protein